MDSSLVAEWTRRATIGGLAAGAGAGLTGLGLSEASAEPPPEVTRLRLIQDEGIPLLCWAPQYLSMDFLRMEGFEDIELVDFHYSNNAYALAEDIADFAVPLATDVAIEADRGAEIKLLAGLHVGCVEVFANDSVASITDLKGARLLADEEDGDPRRFFSAVLSYVGLDPEKDVEWVYAPTAEWVSVFESGGADVVRLFPPMTYELRESGFGRVIMNTTVDDPWRHFYCCMTAARSEFVQKYPIATKRVLRAFAKAQEACADDKQGSARRLVELGITDNLEHASRSLEEIPFGAWREYDPAASLRFFALRLHEAGFIKTSPGDLVERVVDSSFWSQLRTELKT